MTETGHTAAGGTVRADRPAAFDAGAAKKDFPILGTLAHGRPLVYLDNAATTQKPRRVIDSLSQYYETSNSNVHRGVHQLSEKATRCYEDARARVAGFIGAADPAEIVFVRGTTEAINLVCHSWGRQNVGAGDEVIISGLEHHSNIVPWQRLCSETGARLKVIPISDSGELLLDDYERLFSDRTRIVAVNHVSNALGTVNPVERMTATAHARGVPVLVDGAQAVAHIGADVTALGCDFYAFSGHKMYAPMGIGVLYGRRELLEKMPPYQSGGDMIKSVTFERTVYNDIPYLFEAGTPDVAGAVGLGAAISYLEDAGIGAIRRHEDDVLNYATARLGGISGLRIYGTAPEKTAVLSFTMEGVHPHDVGTILDTEGVAVRTGHHCAQPVMERFGIPATVRASFGLYNCRADVDALAGALEKVRTLFP
jgi:cysteine desulfurase/selenocysteine lyase